MSLSLIDWSVKKWYYRSSAFQRVKPGRGHLSRVVVVLLVHQRVACASGWHDDGTMSTGFRWHSPAGGRTNSSGFDDTKEVESSTAGNRTFGSTLGPCSFARVPHEPLVACRVSLHSCTPDEHRTNRHCCSHLGTGLRFDKQSAKHAESPCIISWT